MVAFQIFGLLAGVIQTWIERGTWSPFYPNLTFWRMATGGVAGAGFITSGADWLVLFRVTVQRTAVQRCPLSASARTDRPEPVP